MITQEKDGQIIGRILGRIRQEKKAQDPKWTLFYVAEQAKLEEKYVGRLLRGEKAEPQFVTIGKLADALEINLDELWKQFLREKDHFHEEDY